MPAVYRSSTRHPLTLPILGWSAGAVFFFYAWVLRVSPSVMVEELMRDFGVGAALLGNLSAAYFYGYAGMQIPVGLLLDRFGARRLMTLAALCCAFGCLVFALGGGVGAVIAGRFLIGAAAAFSLVGAMAVAAQWFTPNRFALLSGFAMGIGMAGGMIGQAPLRLGVAAFDWRTVMLVLSACGVVLALYIWCTVRDKPKDHRQSSDLLQGLKVVIGNKQSWLIALAGLGSTTPLLAFAGLWGIPFLEQSYGMSRLTAATLTSLMIAGWGVGSPLWGWLSGWFKSRRAPLLLGVFLEVVMMILLLYTTGLNLWLVAALCFCVGLFGSVNITCFALIREIHPPHLTSTAIGLVNAMVTGGGALFQPVVGILLDYAAAGVIENGVRIYSTDNYRLALSAIVVSCVLSFIFAFMIKPRPDAA